MDSLLPQFDETTDFTDQGPADQGKFSWSRCNISAVPVAVSLFSLTPDPIQFGQKLTISGSVFVGEQINANNTVKVICFICPIVVVCVLFCFQNWQMDLHHSPLSDLL